MKRIKRVGIATGALRLWEVDSDTESDDSAFSEELLVLTLMNRKVKADKD